MPNCRICLLLPVVSRETILVGHSLENDLKALKVVHRRCVDTTVLYPHPKGFPLRQSLKYITRKYLDVNIQSYKSAGAAGELGVLSSGVWCPFVCSALHIWCGSPHLRPTVDSQFPLIPSFLSPLLLLLFRTSAGA